MKKIIIVSFLVLLEVSAFAQKSLEIKKANMLYTNMQYGPAIPFYESVLERDTSSMEVKAKLADCYRRINDSKNAERIYENLARANQGNPDFVLRYAEALSENGKHKEAKNWYEQYKKISNNDLRGEQNAKALSNLAKLYKDSSNYKIQSMELNSPQADFSPMYFKNGLVFCSGRRQGVGIKKVFTWNQSAFLDLYATADTGTLIRQSYKTIPETDQYERVLYDKDNGDNKKHHTPSHTDDTYHTSNDSRTAGYYNSTFIGKAPKNTSTEKVTKLKNKINSSYHEGPVSFYQNEDSVLFTRNNFYKSNYKKAKDGTNRLKIYTAVYKEGQWTEIKNFPLNNDEYSVGHPALTPDKKTLYFVSDMPGGLGGSDIWISRLENGTWSTPVNAGKTINTAGQEMFPYIDAVGNLYFSSDGLGGLGGLDIFRAAKLKTKEGFKTPVNIGFPVNSRKDDFGFISDGELIKGYFSSNRKSGGYDDDIYAFTYTGPKTILLEGIALDKTSQKILDSTRVVIYNAGNPTDSMVTTAAGLFTSVRVFPDETYIVKAYRNKYKPDSTSFSTFDLSRGDTVRTKVLLKKKEIFICVKGTVISEEDKQLMLGIKVRLTNKCMNTSEDIVTGSDGTYKICMVPDACYTLSVERENCAGIPFLMSTIGMQDDFTFIHDFDMLCKGDIVKLDNIYYDLGKFNIRADAAKELEKVLPMMYKYPGMKIELRSHTDCRASDKYNLTLSDKRAKAAAAYLVSKGINKSRVVGKGYGESLLLNKCDDGVVCSEEEHQINRRTEFKILSMGTGKTKPVSDQQDVCACKTKAVPAIPPMASSNGKLTIQLKGQTYLEKTKESAGGITLLLTNNTDNSYNEVQSDANGNYTFELKPMASYTLTASKDGCATYSKEISTVGITSTTILQENISFICE